MKKTQAIVLAGGVGNRFGGDIPKQFIKIAGKTVIEHTIAKLDRNELVFSIIIVVNPDYYDYLNELVLKVSYKKNIKIVKGGSTRQLSSYAGLLACDDDTDYVLLHDAVRPFLSQRIIRDMIRALDKYKAVDVAIDASDTIIQVDENRIINNIPERKYIKRGQTPQAFHLDIIKKAYRIFIDGKKTNFTDDCGLIIEYKLAPVYVIKGEESNIKITHPEDVYLADKLFQMNSITDISQTVFPDNFKDKVFVIFGHSSGIGNDIYNIAKECGAVVYGYSRSNNVDISNCKAVKKVFDDIYEHNGKIDYVVNTAGILEISKLEVHENKDILNIINTNYIGAVNITKMAIKFLRESKGSILHFTSSSYTRGRANYSIYSSTKAAIVNFVQAVAEETLKDDIRINVINPERTKTPMRVKNFGVEPEETLLTSNQVARVSLNTLISNYTGQVIDVRRENVEDK